VITTNNNKTNNRVNVHILECTDLNGINI